MTKEWNRAFSGIPIIERSEKPRKDGLTMAFDYGYGLGYVRDAMEMYGRFLDVAKIRVGSPVLYETELLRKKIEIYNEYDVAVEPGGLLLEYAVAQGKEKEFFEGAKEVGFNLIEVSDNDITLDASNKLRLIRMAREEYGFQVVGEVGSKFVSSSVDKMIDDINVVLNAGCEKVIVEAADLFENGTFREEIFKQICAEIPPNKMVFELPSMRIPNITYQINYQMQKNLVKYLGPDVSVGNVEFDQIMLLEGVRRNVDAHIDMKKAADLAKQR